MTHLIFTDEPRCGTRININHRFWDIVGVMHHGGTNKYTLNCSDPFAQGGHSRQFSAEVRA